jgi:hypothetical protein
LTAGAALTIDATGQVREMADYVDTELITSALFAHA